jgi:hypothetical protein
MSFAETEFKDKASGKVVHAGDVYKMNNWGAFADVVVMGFDAANAQVQLSRPYLYASSVGTTAPTPLLGCETYELPIAHLLAHYAMVENDGHRIA